MWDIGLSGSSWGFAAYREETHLFLQRSPIGTSAVVYILYICIYLYGQEQKVRCMYLSLIYFKNINTHYVLMFKSE